MRADRFALGLVETAFGAGKDCRRAGVRGKGGGGGRAALLVGEEQRAARRPVAQQRIQLRGIGKPGQSGARALLGRFRDDRTGPFGVEPVGHAQAERFAKGVPLNHVGLLVDDLDAAEAVVVAAGLTPFNHGDYEPGRRFYFFDWDGIEFEVVSYG